MVLGQIQEKMFKNKILTTKGEIINYGKINIVAGSAGILLASIGGMMLGLTYNDFFKDGSYMIDLSRALLKAAHTHGQPLAMYNLIFALLINQVVLTDRSRKIASWAAVLSLVMPVGMVLRGLTDGAMTFAPVAMIGVLGFFVSAGFLLAGCTGMNENRKA